MWSDVPGQEQVDAAREAIADLFPQPAAGSAPLRLGLGHNAAPPLTVAGVAARRVGVWLDGGDAGGHQIPLRARAILSGAGGRSRLQVGTRASTLDVEPLVLLEELLRHLAKVGAGVGPRLFGFLGYDLGALIEEMPELPAADLPLPDMWFAVADVWLEGDPVAAGLPIAWSLRADAAWCGEAELRTLRTELLAELQESSEREVAGEVPAEWPDVSSRPDEGGYRRAVSRTVARIHAGDLFEANICRRLEADWLQSPWTLYQRLRASSPADYGAYLAGPEWAVLSVSPELFLRVRDGAVQTRPIKGTRPRGRDDEEDARMVQQLLDSEKDAAELSMIVDLARNDLGRVCTPGSVRVVEHRAPVTLPTVHHTYSVVAGDLLPETSTVRLLRAAFPPGSITGAPKIQAMRVAYAEEPCRRGVAMGSIGWIDPCGDMELSVAIRTATVVAERATYHAGCGIVADSSPEEELEETVAKARPFLLAIGDG